MAPASTDFLGGDREPWVHLRARTFTTDDSSILSTLEKLALAGYQFIYRQMEWRVFFHFVCFSVHGSLHSVSLSSTRFFVNDRSSLSCRAE